MVDKEAFGYMRIVTFTTPSNGHSLPVLRLLDGPSDVVQEEAEQALLVVTILDEGRTETRNK